ncbi:hypothetical protein ANN_13887 [Periplaneta americana]|uniref:Uncharacterized protein n=1 Tax=Periplaneta americana TaxID=6978 RepID=A0ABQ8SVC3_PERAM|nr:hypothetical protein ANN_13887 [Periplaneta americana]
MTGLCEGGNEPPGSLKARADINSDHVLLIGAVDIRLKKIRGINMRKKLNMEKLKDEEDRRKFQAYFQEKAATLESTPENSNKYWTHLKSRIQTTVEKAIGYTEGVRIKKPWVTGKIFER